MKLSTKSEYSILALIYLARSESGDFVKMEAICESYTIPKKYMELLFTVLRQNRFIKTKRGAKGGYMLAKPASEISLAEIIRLMDGALAATESVSRYFYSDTPLLQEPKIIDVFREIRDFTARKLEEKKLSELI